MRQDNSTNFIKTKIAKMKTIDVIKTKFWRDCINNGYLFRVTKAFRLNVVILVYFDVDIMEVKTWRNLAQKNVMNIVKLFKFL